MKRYDYVTMQYGHTTFTGMNESEAGTWVKADDALVVIEAGRLLRLEVDGLRAFELEVREVIGNTNWRVLREKADRLGELWN